MYLDFVGVSYLSHFMHDGYVLNKKELFRLNIYFKPLLFHFMNMIFKVSYLLATKKLALLVALISFAPSNVKAQTSSDATPLHINYFFETRITAKSTDQELSEIQKNFSVDGLQLKISRVKRNAQKEIVRIRIRFVSSDRKQEKFWSSSKPIPPLRVYIQSDKDYCRTFGVNMITAETAPTSLK